jgi:hypothetical protein
MTDQKFKERLSIGLFITLIIVAILFLVLTTIHDSYIQRSAQDLKLYQSGLCHGKGGVIIEDGGCLVGGTAL